MKLFNTNQIREIDQYTIDHEPISSVDLMERAANRWVAAFLKHEIPVGSRIAVLCGPGNNGGDGLVIARMLSQKGYSIHVFRIGCSKNVSADHEINLKRLKKLEKPITIMNVDDPGDGGLISTINESNVIVDAIFGSGLNRPIIGELSALVKEMNALKKLVYTVDVPSGMFADSSTTGTVLNCHHCITFQFPKLSLLLPENNIYLNSWECIDIDLHPSIIDSLETKYFYTDEEIVKHTIKRKAKFSHKGSNGHGLLIAGSYDKMGAAILSARSCLKSGCGLLDVHSVKKGYDLLLQAVPEAMVSVDLNENYVTEIPKDLGKYSAIGIGPGLDQKEETVNAIDDFINNLNLLSIWDADAINILAKNKAWLKRLPTNTILTPHPGEFRRLVGEWKNDFEKLDLLRTLSTSHDLIVVLKGAHTVVALPDGTFHFNSTGNPGMATAGSGDVLTGVILSLLCQGYRAEEAVLLGVYLHGLSGDLSLEKESHESLIASDIIKYLGKAFKSLKK